MDFTSSNRLEPYHYETGEDGKLIPGCWFALILLLPVGMMIENIPKNFKSGEVYKGVCLLWCLIMCVR